MTERELRGASIACPFYKSDDSRRRIICEGFTDQCRVAVFFKNRAAFEQQLELFCRQYYDKCEVYRMNLEKYDL